MPIIDLKQKPSGGFFGDRLCFALKFSALINRVARGISKTELEVLASAFFPDTVVTEKEKLSLRLFDWLIYKNNTGMAYPSAELKYRSPGDGEIACVEPGPRVLSESSPYGDRDDCSYVDGIDGSLLISLKTETTHSLFLPMKSTRKWKLTLKEVLDLFSCPEGAEIEQEVCERLVKDKIAPAPIVRSTLKSILSDPPRAYLVECVMDLFEKIVLEKIEKDQTRFIKNVMDLSEGVAPAEPAGAWDWPFGEFFTRHLELIKGNYETLLEMRALKTELALSSGDRATETGHGLVEFLNEGARSSRQAARQDAEAFFHLGLEALQNLDLLRGTEYWNESHEEAIQCLKSLGLSQERLALAGVGLVMKETSFTRMDSIPPVDRVVERAFNAAIR